MAWIAEHFDDEDPRIRRLAWRRNISVEDAKQLLLRETPLKAQMLLAEYPFETYMEQLEKLGERAEPGSVVADLIKLLMKFPDQTWLHLSLEEVEHVRKTHTG